MERFDRKAVSITVGGVARDLRGRVTPALTGLVAAAGPTPAAWAQGRTSEWTWGMHPMPWMWGAWGLGMMLMMLVFWGLVIAGIVLGIRWLVKTGAGAPRDRALEILRERYARGEINKDEFDAKQRDLR